MTLVLDSGVVYAYYDRDDDWHPGSRGLLDAEPGPLALPAVVLPEVDHLLGTRIGLAAQRALYEDVVEQVYLVVDLDTAGYRRIQELNHRYPDLGLGFVDAAVVAICERMQVRTLATTDRRHFPAISKDVALKLVPEPPHPS
jgi:predicted nucleic acid-binding protein